MLRGLTPRQVERFRKKGIFTLQQLSYQFCPRRHKRQEFIVPRFRPELQALAIREQKVYVAGLPDFTRSTAELFLDIEGADRMRIDEFIRTDINNQKNIQRRTDNAK